MARILLIAAILTTLAFLAPAASAAPLDQGHRGSVTVNVTPQHGTPFGFRVPRPFGFHPFGLPPILVAPPVIALPLPPPPPPVVVQYVPVVVPALAPAP